MNKKIIASSFVMMLSLLFLLPAVTATDGVTITIKGGINLKVSITNEKTSSIEAYVNLTAKRVFRPAYWNSTGNGTLTPYETVKEVFKIPQISSFNIVVSAENQTVERKGISIFHFVILFR